MSFLDSVTTLWKTHCRITFQYAGSDSHVVRNYLLSGDTSRTTFLHGAVITVRELFFDMWCKTTGDLLLFVVYRVANDVDSFSQCDTSLFKSQLGLTPGSLFETDGGGFFDILEELYDNIVGSFLKTGKEVSLKHLSPSAGELPREGSAEVDIEILTPLTMTAESYTDG